MDFLEPFDLGFLYFVGSLRRGWLDPAVEWLTLLGGAAVLVPVAVAVAAVFALARRPVRVLVMLVAPFGSWGIEWAVKRVVDRPRPDVTWRTGDLPANPSFPSAHATNAMSVYALSGLLLAPLLPAGRRRSWVVCVGVGLGVAVGATRLYLGVHWPTDVLAGWALGLGWALAASGVAERLEGERPAPPKGSGAPASSREPGVRKR